MRSNVRSDEMISSSEQKEPTEVSSGIEGLRQGNNANYMPHLTQPGGAPNRERRRNTAFSLVEIRDKGRDSCVSRLRQQETPWERAREKAPLHACVVDGQL